MNHPGEAPPGRKRSRSNCEDGGCDFMPLSKRINNLHLTGTAGTIGQAQHEGLLDPATCWGSSGNPCLTNSPAEGYAGGTPQRPQGTMGENDIQTSALPWVTDQVLSQYAPVLNATDNPFYYENNKLLFALYMERLQRVNDHQ